MDHNATYTHQIDTSRFQNGFCTETAAKNAQVATRRAAQVAAAKVMIERLCETWPRCFYLYQKRRRPLKIGVRLDIIALRPDIDGRELGIALRIYTSNYCYLKACCRAGVDRVGLGGEPAGTVSASEAANAAASLAARNAKRQAKKNTAPVITAGPKRLSLDDLRAAAARRRPQMKTPVSTEANPGVL